jgi:hypothetical protein
MRISFMPFVTVPNGTAVDFEPRLACAFLHRRVHSFRDSALR